MMRGQLRLIVCVVVIVVIAITSILEPPSLTQGVGFGLVVVAMVTVIVRERNKPR
jgi:hypothetical protein